MPRNQFTDVPDGDTVTYDVVDDSNGFRQCTFLLDSFDTHQAIFNNVKNIQCKNDDIFLASYPKTGTNWLWEMLMMVIEKSREVTDGHKGKGMIEGAPAEALEAMQSPRLLNSHLKIRYLPKEVKEKKVKTVLLVRNPKDTVVSFYNHTRGIQCYEYDGKFENYTQMFMRGEVDYGSYPEYLREWQAYIRENPDLPIHVMAYEDMKQDCFKEMKTLCSFLGYKVEDDLLQEVVANCQIDKLRQSKTDKLSDEMKQFFLGKVLRNNFSIYRKGQVGDWKNWFTVAQNEAFETWWNNEAQDLTMFKFRYS